MAASFVRLLRSSAAVQAAGHQPVGQVLAPVVGTSPGQSIMRRFFADGTQTIDRAKVEAGDAAQKGQDYAKETKDSVAAKADQATEKAKEVAGGVKETARSASGTAQDKAQEAKKEGESVVGKVQETASREMDTASDMAKDLPAKTKETAQSIKEVGIEAAKAVKRDASKVAEKIGLKTPSTPSN